MQSLLSFLRELKYSYHLNEQIYTQGSCFRLYKILQSLFLQANPYYSHLDGHWITEIDGKFYDINGEINWEYTEHKEYKLVTDEVTLASACVPTYGRQCTGYGKYKETV